MTKFKIRVSFDEKNFFWIIVENGKIVNMNPTKEDLADIKLRSYNKTNTFDRCKEEYERNGKELTDNNILYPGKIYREKDKDGKWIGIYDCKNCYEKYDPNSSRNKLKLEADCRNNNLDPDSHPGVGYIAAVW